MEENRINFISPIEGDMLHGLDGIMTDEYLKVKVQISAPGTAKLTVNGAEAALTGGVFEAEVCLTDNESSIEAEDQNTGEAKVEGSRAMRDAGYTAQSAPHLDQHEKNGNKPSFLDLLVREQYFYLFYEAYQPDYSDKVLAAVQWADDNGYTTSFLSEAISSKNVNQQIS